MFFSIAISVIGIDPISSNYLYRFLWMIMMLALPDACVRLNQHSRRRLSQDQLRKAVVEGVVPAHRNAAGTRWLIDERDLPAIRQILELDAVEGADIIRAARKARGGDPDAPILAAPAQPVTVKATAEEILAAGARRRGEV